MYLTPYRFATGIAVLLTEGADIEEEPSVFKFTMAVPGASTAHRQFGLQLMLPEADGGLGD